MKIGTITFHCAYNYGSVLQAYALQHVLELSGHQVEVMDYISSDFQKFRLFRHDNFRQLVSDILFFGRNLRRRNSFRRFQRDFLNLSKRRYIGEKADANLRQDAKDFDAFICGSDQIWNLDCTQGVVGPFFLDFVPSNCKKIAYAPSLGHTEFEPQYFTPANKRKLTSLLDRFDAISVRECSTVNLYQQLTKNPIHTAVDPVLLLTADAYRAIESVGLPHKLTKGHFIFFYVLWDNSPESNPAMIKEAESLSRHFHLPVVYIAKRNIHFSVRSINCYGVSPNDFLALIDNASFILSNSFHATVFSVIFHKQFITISPGQSSSRIRDLLNILGLSELFITLEGIQNATNVMEQPNDFSSVDDDLQRLRDSSQQFITNALEDEKISN